MMRITPCSNAHLLVFVFLRCLSGHFFDRKDAPNLLLTLDFSIIGFHGLKLSIAQLWADCIKEQKISIVPNRRLSMLCHCPMMGTNVTPHSSRKGDGDQNVSPSPSFPPRRQDGSRFERFEIFSLSSLGQNH